MRGVTAPAPAGDVAEQEIRSRLDSIRVGIWLTVIVCLGGGAYALHTWSGPHRDLIIAATVLGLLSVPVLLALPGERIVRSPYADLFFIGWSVSDILLVAAIAGLDGGSTSPYVLLLVLPFLFAALAYTPRAVAVVGLVDIVVLAVLAFAVGGGLPLDGFGLFAMVCVGLMGTWEARNLTRQRNALSETAAARARSEETSRKLTRQQMAVAQFGQLALEGTDIDELTDEATALMQRVLDIDIGGVLKLLPGGDELLLISAAGLPEEDVGRTRVATGHQSQSGYALATGLPIVVDDWHTENRFRESKLQADAGMRSAVTS
jgi:hypothetical protein